MILLCNSQTNYSVLNEFYPPLPLVNLGHRILQTFYVGKCLRNADSCQIFYPISTDCTVRLLVVVAYVTLFVEGLSLNSVELCFPYQ